MLKFCIHIVCCLCRHSLVKMLDGGELDGPPPLRRASTTDTPPSHSHQHTSHSHPRLTRRASLDDLENDSCTLTPKVEQRIVQLNDEVSCCYYVCVCFYYLQTVKLFDRLHSTFMKSVVSKSLGCICNYWPN